MNKKSRKLKRKKQQSVQRVSSTTTGKIPGRKDGDRSSLWNLLVEPVDLFSRQERPRIEPLDLGRGYALFCVIFFHGVFFLGTAEVRTISILSLFKENIMWMSEMRAVFIVYLGIYLVYSQPATRKLLIRGTQLILLGYALNIFRYLPIIIGISMGVLSQVDFAPYNDIGDMVFKADVFHVAGLSCFLFAIFRKRKGPSIRPVYWFFLALLVLFITPFFVGQETGLYVVDHFLNLFWGRGINAFFSVLPYFSYCLIGIMLGSLLLKARETHNLDRTLLISGGILFMLGVLFTDILGEPSRLVFVALRGEPFSPLTVETFTKATGYIMCWQGLFFWLYKKSPNNFVLRTFSYWSKNIIVFFIWHWIVFGWICGLYFQAFRQQNTLEVAVVILVTLLLTHFLTRLTAGPMPVIYQNNGYGVK